MIRRTPLWSNRDAIFEYSPYRDFSEPVGRFFMTHTKAELLEGALKHRTMLYPVSTTKDIVESTQLARPAATLSRAIH